MDTLDLYMDFLWTGIIESIKDEVNSHEDANMSGNLERCRNTWECYADNVWRSLPFEHMYDVELVNPICSRAIEELSDDKVTALLALYWDEFLEDNDPGVAYPWLMDIPYQRKGLLDVLYKAIHAEAQSTGVEVEERAMSDFDEHPEEE